MSRLSSLGISVELPAGWEGRISQREPEPFDGRFAGAARGDEAATTGALLHAANFALPSTAGHFGSGAVEMMTAPDLLVILFEYDRTSASTPLFAAAGVPRVQVEDFSRVALQRVLEGQGGTQKFFNAAGRALCLYVVLGSFTRRIRTVPLVNDLLSTITIS